MSALLIQVLGPLNTVVQAEKASEKFTDSFFHPFVHSTIFTEYRTCTENAAMEIGAQAGVKY